VNWAIAKETPAKKTSERVSLSRRITLAHTTTPKLREIGAQKKSGKVAGGRRDSQVRRLNDERLTDEKRDIALAPVDEARWNFSRVVSTHNLISVYYLGHSVGVSEYILAFFCQISKLDFFVCFEITLQK